VNVHKNAKLTPAGRALLVRRLLSGERQAGVAWAFGVSRRMAGKWLQRWRAEGEQGLTDRSSRPRRCPRQLGRCVVCRIEQLRRQRWTSPAIAARVRVPLATVGEVLRRLGLNRLRALELMVQSSATRRRAGELGHVDTKWLGVIRRVCHRIHGDYQRRGRGGGWEHVHVLVDDATRLAYTELLPTADIVSAAGFLRRAVAWLGHPRRTRHYRPRTNGKAGRFIQTCLREWAYQRPYRTSAVRAAALPIFTRHYNVERPHWALQRRPPLARLLELGEQRA
jgi:transposase